MAGRRGAPVAVLAICVILAVAAGHGHRPDRGVAGPSLAAQGATPERSPEGLRFRLSDAEPTVAAPPRVVTPPSVALEDRQAQALLDRLPPLATAPSDEQPFALPDKSLPPPRTGKVVADTFPPSTSSGPPPAIAAGPLTVLRHSPDGAVSLAPNLSVTFSQPMVAVTSHGELAHSAVPVRMTPQPAGTWRWIGAQTLVFETPSRLPMATDYQVEVPAGTASAAGAMLAKAERWTFSTPPPTLLVSRPADVPTPFDPLLFAGFDQKIDAAAVLRSVRVEAGTKVPRLRLATEAEMAADTAVAKLAKEAPPESWLAFRVEEPLPPGTRVTVKVAAGIPSAEGPKKTTAPQQWQFRTYGPMRVTDHRCPARGCPPSSSWQISFSNPIDVQTVADDIVRVEPPLPGLKVSAYRSDLYIAGQSRGRTTYRVTISPRLHDTFGQALQKEEAITFQTGVAARSLTSRTGPFVVLDPSAPPRFPVYTVNHESIRVQVRAVEPGDWPAFGRAIVPPRGSAPPALPGRVVLTETLPVKGRPDELTETDIDLKRVLPDGLGQVVLFVAPGELLTERVQPIYVWVQATRIGLDAFADGQDLIAWASSLDTGAPLAHVQLSMVPDSGATTTGADGMARLRLGDQSQSLLVARLGKDVAILPPYAWPYPGRSPWQRPKATDRLSWYVFDDRRMYRPGEEVHVKGWLRIQTGGPNGDVTPVKDTVRTVNYTLRDSRRNEIGKGSATLNAFGGFDFAVKLPAAMNLGYGELRLESDAVGFLEPSFYTHMFQVQEFRRPEFEVTTRASDGPYIVGGHATITASASYYAGGGLPNANLTWNAYSSPGSFTPPNRGDYTFGTWVPWWGDFAYSPGGRAQRQSHEAVTDATGKHVVRIDFDAIDPPRVTNLAVNVTVTDVNRQSWSSGVNLVVHPSTVYVGMKTERYFVDRGQPLPVDLIVTDLDGRAVAGRPVQVRAERMDWRQERGTWQEKALDAQECSVTSAAEPSRCTFKTPDGGTYRVTATVTDDAGRPNETQIRRWVAGGTIPRRPDVSQQRVTLIPDKEQYRAGDVAQILVATPFYPAQALMTLRRSGIVRTERFTFAGPSYTLRIPIEERWTPNVRVQMDLVGATVRTMPAGQAAPKLPKQPAFASGSLNLRVPPADRTLALIVAPRAREVEPGGETRLDVTLRDAAGQPVAGGEVAVVVVDEAILSLTRYQLPDPVQWFYRDREPGVSDCHLRSSVLLASPQALDLNVAARAAAGSGDVQFRTPLAESVTVTGATEIVQTQAAVAGGGPGPIAMRTDFNPLALFAASVPTDGSGHAEVRVTLPDNVTRYRVMAVAATEGAKFGSGESTITARLPLMVRASAPRFLNVGDRIEFPVVLQNQTDTALAVDVAMRASNAELSAGRGRRVTVPANDRVEVRFPLAASRPGTARFQIAAASGRWSDASEVSLPVWTPATTEAFATYGQIDQGAIVQRVKAPADAFAEFGGLEIDTSSTALQALTDAVVYLVTYPFECAEQLSSRVLAVAALKDVLAAFSARGLPDADTLAAGVNRDLQRLSGLQNDDGGFALWQRGDESWPYVSIHVAHALERARSKGFTVPDKTLQRSRDYLKNVEQHIPASYGDDARRALVAYALYVRSLGGDADRGRARSLIREAGLEKLSFEAIGWLLSVLSGDAAFATEVASIRTWLNNHVIETAGAAHFAVSYRDGAHLLFESDRRADGVVLDALITDQPKSDLIPKIVTGLLAHRTAGRWDNTQENAFILLALDRYFNTFEKVTPDFVARAWLGDRYAGEQAFKGRTTDRHVVRVPMKALADVKGATDLIVSKEGTGRLYYRIGLQYAPRDLDLKAIDRGFTVERSYAAVDDEADVHRDKDGTWHVRAGARVRVRLSMVAPARRYHVALVDPLPAGLEALNPALATTAPIPRDTRPDAAPGGGADARWFWIRPWFEHQNLRDDRVEVFASLLWEGVHTYSYVARATTPGQFIVPPPRAEEMYHPETFGRGATDRVVVETR